jgi:CCR4-NOT transcription complex subunit 9
MMNAHNVYGQHHQYSGQVEPAWVHQQNAHRAQQAAAAAASAAQQQHYHQQVAATHNTANALLAHSQEETIVSEDNRRTLSYVADLLNENTREAALLELSKKREQVPELALILWHSFGMFPALARDIMVPPLLTPVLAGVMTSLLQEIISVYNLLNPSQLTAAASNRVCNALALLQCVASHNETRTLFLNGEFAAPSKLSSH